MNLVDLKIIRVFDAPVERVWAAWSEEKLVKKWWGPKGFTCPVAKIDFRVGGKYLSSMHGPKGSEWDRDMYSTGVYKEIIPIKKIVCTDSFSDKEGNVISATEIGFPKEIAKNFPMEMTIKITFKEINGKAEMTLIHNGQPKDVSDMANQGWSEQFDKLDKLLK